MGHRVDTEYKGLRVLVVGAGRSGLAASSLLARMGAQVTLTDLKNIPEEGEDLKKLRQSGVQFKWGDHCVDSFVKAEKIIVSPGVSLSIDPLKRAAEKGIPILGEIELASSLLRGRLVAITGTNGKSTTTTLIGQIMKRCFPSVFIGGNLGNPLSEALLQKEEWDVLVVEVSSFQLETIQHFHPSIAVLLNITPDHLDRYLDFEHYSTAKTRLFQNMDKENVVVFNGEDPEVLAAVENIPCRLVPFQKTGDGKKGVYLHKGDIFSAIEGDPKLLFRKNDFSHFGEQNVENLLASVAVGQVMQCPEEEMKEALKHFAGLEHRMEQVREIQGVRFINDSKGTNVAALKMSLQSVSSPVVLIAGGRDKGGLFSSLESLVKEKVRCSILLGEAAPVIQEAWRCEEVCRRVNSLEEAVQEAWKVSKPGDVVLFSPGCSSLDMFQNFEERGRVFKEKVRSL